MLEGDEVWRDHLSWESDQLLRIARHGMMQGDAKMVTDLESWRELNDDRTPQQLVNSAALPGLVGDAWAMPDWHFGYGLPIGGVVATSPHEGGVVSPGGVGFDINCGVRLATTKLTKADVLKDDSVGIALRNSIPAGVSGKGGVKLSESELISLLEGGEEVAEESGLISNSPIGVVESDGRMEVDGVSISQRALKRGLKSLGTLGSGNHFLELQVVDEIHDASAAKAFGLQAGMVTVMVHSGSRGLGHQVASDHLKALESNYRQVGNNWVSDKWGHTLPDRQLAAAPIDSEEGIKYLNDMAAAANFAFSNRAVLMERVRRVLDKNLRMDSGVSTLYDVAHNIAKFEKHEVGGTASDTLVHRKGATRAFPGDHIEVSNRYSGFGQPVLIPGDMGTASWVLAGPKNGMNQAFGSSCHGAGRKMSRSAAKQQVNTEELQRELRELGICVHAKTDNVFSEEAPEAYKEVDGVVGLTEAAGLARRVARLKPLIVIKG